MTDYCAKQKKIRSENGNIGVKGRPLNSRQHAQNFLKNVHKTPTCWLWLGRLDAGKYGRVTVGRKSKPAHRWLYEALNGYLPNAIHLDHLCRIRHCVNPAHLEAVTPFQNFFRGKSPSRNTFIKEVCKWGHRLTQSPYNDRHHFCRTCLKNEAKIRWQKIKNSKIANGTYAGPRFNRTHCKKGHEFTNENTLSQKNGTRRCKICRKASRKFR